MSARRSFAAADGALLAVVAAASITSVAGFRAVFAGWEFMVPAVIGGVGAAIAVGVAWWRRLLIGESVALSVIVLVVVGAIATSGLPTPDAFRALFNGLTSGWADLLSLTPPVDTTPELRVLPFVLAWVGTTVGGELLRRTNAPALPTLGPLISLAVAVLVTAENRGVGLAQGAVIAVGALVIGVGQFRHNNGTSGTLNSVGSELRSVEVDTDDGSARRQRLRLVRVGVALALVGVTAPVLGPRLPFADAHDRFDLRDRNDPPWDPLSVPSPLVQLKSSLKDEVRDDVMFTVTSTEPVTRWNLAVLGNFDGVVWTVGSADGRDAEAEFRAVGSELPQSARELTTPVDRETATITIAGLRGPWLPFAGATRRIEFGDTTGTDGTSQPAEALRMNLVTGTLAIPTGVSSGFSYSIDVDIPRRPSDAELAALPITSTQPLDADIIPPPIRNLAADVVEGVDFGWPQVIAVQNTFVTQGFYDTSIESRPGHSYFRLAEFLDDPDRLIGFEEQYAAAAATITRIAGLPTRVVVGYLIAENRYVDGTAAITSSDISAWIEIDVGNAGWIPIDVAPDRSREPVAEETGVSVEDVAVPSPPPPPQIPPNLDVFSGDEELDDEPEEEPDDEPEATGGVSRLAIAGAALGGFFGIGLLIIMVIIIWKTRRRTKRRNSPDPALQIGYAWRETLDRYHEAGLSVPDRSTPTEAVRSIVDAEPGACSHEQQLRDLVVVVQRAAYHADPPDAEAGATAWHYYDDVSESMRRQRSFGTRVRMDLDPRTLRRRGWDPRSGNDRTPKIDS